MPNISYPNLGIGVCSYGVAAMDIFTLGKELGNKTHAASGRAFSHLASLTASFSWAVLWTHSVKMINLGRHLSGIERVCFSAFALLYGKLAYEGGKDLWEFRQSALSANPAERNLPMLRPCLWRLAGDVSFLGWSVLCLVQAVTTGIIAPAAPLCCLAAGVAAFAISYWRREAQERIGS